MIPELIATSASLEPGLEPATVGTIIGSVVLSLLGGGLIGKKVTENKMTVEPQPQPQALAVKMEEHFVTRREFDKLEGVVAVNSNKMEALFEKAVEKMEERHDRLTESIDKTSKNAYEGRARIWKEVNDQGSRLKSVEDRTPKPTGS